MNYDGNMNVLVIGGSGAGKTRYYVKPNVCQMNSDLFITDPKGDLLLDVGLIEGNVEYGEDWIDALASIVKPRTKMPADAVTVAAPIFATAETLEYDEKSVNKGLAKEGMGAILDAAKAALEGVTEWTAANIDAALEPLPEQMDLKKRVVFQAVRVAVCGNMVSPPLGETMALVGRDDCLARIDRARTMAL